MQTIIEGIENQKVYEYVHKGVYGQLMKCLNMHESSYKKTEARVSKIWLDSIVTYGTQLLEVPRLMEEEHRGEQVSTPEADWAMEQFRKLEESSSGTEISRNRRR